MKTITFDVTAKSKVKSAGMVTEVVNGAVKANKSNQTSFSVKGVSFILKKMRDTLVIM